MAGDMFLQEAEAAVLVFDLRGFTPLCARLGPIELGAALGRFYEHCEAAVDAGGGRVIKLVGDMVVSVWVAGQHGPPHGGHTGGALTTIRRARATRAAWAAENQRLGVPLMAYSMGAAAGRVLVGQLGTEKLRGFDVLGAPANVAFKLTPVATTRDVDNLVTAALVPDEASDASDLVEVDGVELGGVAHRLYRVTSS